MGDTGSDKFSFYAGGRYHLLPSTSFTSGGDGWSGQLTFGYEDFDGGSIFGIGGQGVYNEVTGKLLADDPSSPGAGTTNKLTYFNVFGGKEAEFYKVLSDSNQKWLSLRFGSQIGFGFGSLDATRPELTINGTTHPAVGETFSFFDIQKENQVSALFTPFDSRFGIKLSLGLATGIVAPFEGYAELAKKFPFSPQIAAILFGIDLGYAARPSEFMPAKLRPLDIGMYYYASVLGLTSDLLSYKATGAPTADTAEGLDEAGFSGGEDGGIAFIPSTFDVPLMQGAIKFSSAMEVTRRREFFQTAPSPWQHVDFAIEGIRAIGYLGAGYGFDKRDLPLLQTGFSSLTNFTNESFTYMGLPKKYLPFTGMGLEFAMFLIGGAMLANDSESVAGEALTGGATTNFLSYTMSPDPTGLWQKQKIDFKISYGKIWGDIDTARTGLAVRKHFEELPLFTEFQLKTPIIGGSDEGPTDLTALFGPEYAYCAGGIACFDVGAGLGLTQRYQGTTADAGPALQANAGVIFNLPKGFGVGAELNGGLNYLFKSGDFDPEVNGQFVVRFTPGVF